MIVNVTHSDIAEARLSRQQVDELAKGSMSDGPMVVLQAEGLGAPRQWTSGLPTAVDRIIIEEGAGRARHERSWILAAQTDAVRYYELAHDSSSSGYVTR